MCLADTVPLPPPSSTPFFAVASMASPVVYFAAAVLVAQSTVALDCSKAPVYVDIHKRAVHQSSAFQYGSFIGVGSPAQNHSLWPSISQNHTSFGAPSYCENGNSTLRNCDVSTGGFFSSQDSTRYVLLRTHAVALAMTYSSHSYVEPNDLTNLDPRQEKLEGRLGRDTVRLYTHYFEVEAASQTLLENSIVEVAEEGTITPAILGMGFSSTVLRDLAAKDVIAGRTYSLYIGQGFDRAGGAVNGSNTFGGYDSGRFTEPVHKYPMNTARMNPMTVRVKDIVITGPKDSNTSTSLFDPIAFPNMVSRPDTFEAELTTDQYPLSLPYQITQNFISRLNAEQDNTWGDNSLRLKSAFEGTLSIVLEDGFTVTLPPRSSHERLEHHSHPRP